MPIFFKKVSAFSVSSGIKCSFTDFIENTAQILIYRKQKNRYLKERNGLIEQRREIESLMKTSKPVGDTATFGHKKNVLYN